MSRFTKTIFYLLILIILVTCGWYLFLSNKSMKHIPKNAKLVFYEDIYDSEVVFY